MRLFASCEQAHFVFYKNFFGKFSALRWQF
nr:MAG TPA: hypothetical protein [Caudoviricetes sp.]